MSITIPSKIPALTKDKLSFLTNGLYFMARNVKRNQSFVKWNQDLIFTADAPTTRCCLFRLLGVGLFCGYKVLELAQEKIWNKKMNPQST